MFQSESGLIMNRQRTFSEHLMTGRCGVLKKTIVNIKTMRLKVDIDNVIRDMGAEMVKIHNEMFETELTKADITDYDVNIAFPKFLETGIDAREYFFQNCARTLYTISKPMFGAIDGLKLAKALGHEIVIVSYQPSYINKLLTLQWLKNNNVPYDSLILTDTPDKSWIPADYIIDDNPKFLEEDSAKTVCIDWAYNKSGNYDYRFSSIYEFVNKILNK